MFASRINRTLRPHPVRRPPNRHHPLRNLGLAAFVATSTLLAPVGAAHAVGVGPGSPTPAGSVEDSSATGSYIVTLNAVSVSGKDRSAASAVAARRATALGAQVERVYGHALNGYAARLTAAQVSALRADPAVASITPDTVESIHTDQVNPPSWGLDRIDQDALPLNATYTYTPFTGAGVHAFVIDTGVRTTHQDFGGRVAVGYTAIGDALGTGDCHGHGTHVAATIGGTTFGVAKGVTIVPVRVAGCSGTATASNTVSGIDWILRERAAGRFPGSAVINLSMGHRVKWYEIAFPIEDALASAMNAGITVTLSAGNSNASACGFSPARMTQPLTVAASDRSDVRATYSNYGSCVDVFAPGTSIVSAGNGSDSAQATKSGTSMAAPHVAGAVARYLEEHPGEQPGIVGGSIMRMATAAVVANAGTGSPNRLLRVNRVGYIEVPHVLGLSCALASGEIRAAGLVPQCTGTGTWVKEQTPFAGSMVPAGSTVRLTLASGPQP